MSDDKTHQTGPESLEDTDLDAAKAGYSVWIGGSVKGETPDTDGIVATGNQTPLNKTKGIHGMETGFGAKTKR